MVPHLFGCHGWTDWTADWTLSEKHAATATWLSSQSLTWLEIVYTRYQYNVLQVFLSALPDVGFSGPLSALHLWSSLMRLWYACSCCGSHSLPWKKRASLRMHLIPGLGAYQFSVSANSFLVCHILRTVAFSLPCSRDHLNTLESQP